jgi:hypothetical protein
VVHRLAVGVFLLATIGALNWLWVFWTPRCNESCPGSVVVAMYATMAAAVVITVAIIALTLLGKLSVKRASQAYVVSLMVFAAWTGLLTSWATR